MNNEGNNSVRAQFILSEQWAMAGKIVGPNNLNGRRRTVDIGMSKAAADFRFTTGITFLFKPRPLGTPAMFNLNQANTL